MSKANTDEQIRVREYTGVEGDIRTGGEIVFIDTGVDDWQTLADGVDPSAEVVLVGANEDGVQVMADALAGRSNVRALHVMGHGDVGTFTLGSATVDNATLSRYGDQIAVVRDALWSDADILLYGCHVGAYARGRAFVDAFAGATGANVAASTTLTGAASLGGDWDLEATSGIPETEVFASQLARDSFAGVLATIDFDSGLTFNGDTLDVLVSGVTVTLAHGGNDINRAYAGNHKGLDGAIVYSAGHTTAPFTFSFSTAVDITSIHAAQYIGSSNGWTFSVTDGSGNSSVAVSGTDYNNGTTVTLNWTGVTSFQFDADDSAVIFNPFFDNLIFSAPNAAPELGGTPADDAATEDVATAIDLSAYNISDDDGDTVTLTLAVDRGSIASTDGNGTTGGVTVSNSGTASMTLAGTVANLNTYLNDTSKIEYTTGSNDTTAATLTVTPNDGTEDGTADTVTINVTAVNDAPTATGTPSDVSVTEDTASDFDLSDVTFTDVEGDSLTVTLVASAGTFSASSGGSVTVGGSGTGSLTLQGVAANINMFLDTISNIQYTGASNANGNNVASFTINANDGTDNPQVGSGNIDITAVNDAPTAAGALTDVAVTEDSESNFDLSAITLTDIDGDNITVTIAASAGTFTTVADGSGVGAGVTEGGQGTDTVTLAGSVADVNTYLNTASNLAYTSALNASGDNAATYNVNVNDGTVNPLLASGNIDIAAVNDAPTVSSAPSDVSVTEDTQSHVDLSAMSFAEVDGDSLTVTLTASAGTFATPADGSGVGGGVTETLVDATTLTLAGAAADISTYLDTAANIQYTPATNVNGQDQATITVSASDGNGGSLATDPVVNVDVTAVNDAPTAAGAPTDVAVTEDSESNFDLSAITLTDVDGDSVTVTIAASAGTFTSVADGSGVGAGVTEGGQGTGTVTLAGSVADVNTYLNTASNLAYTSASNASGDNAATYTVSVNDGTFKVSPQVASGNIDITAVNDAPTVSSAPSDVSVTEDTQSHVDLSAMSFAEVDGDSLTVTLTASAGTFATPADGSGVGGGVTETLVDATTLTLAGAAADISTYLDTAANIQYTPATNVNGQDQATITVSASDGNGGSLATDPVVNVDVTAVNDAPTIATNKGPSVLAGSSVTLTNAHLQATDLDDVADQLTYTLNALPASGTLSLNGTDLAATDTFTQQDINDGLLTFTPGNAGTASFDITLADGGEDGAGAVSGTLSFSVIVPPPPIPAPQPTPPPAPETIDGAPATIRDTIDDTTGNATTVTEVDPVTSGTRSDSNDASGDVDVELGNRVQASISDNLGLTATRQTGSSRDDIRTVITRDNNPDTPDGLDNGNVEDFLGPITTGDGGVDIVTVTPTSSSTEDGDRRANVQITPPDDQDSTPVVVVDARQMSTGGEQPTITISGAGNIVVRGAGEFRGDEELTAGGAPDVDNVLGDNSNQVLFFGPGDDVIRGSGGDDVVGSAGGEDRLFGNSGNDSLSGGADDDLLHGGLHRDTVIVDGNRDDYLVTQDHSIIILQHLESGETDTAVNVEVLEFDDQTLALEYSTDLNWISTLYDRLLGRQGDLDGIQYWASQLEGSDDFVDIVWGFLNSTEFTQNLGQTVYQLDTGAQVDLLYQTLLQREADTAGRDYWINNLESGASLEVVAGAIALSDEASLQHLQQEDWEYIL